ncbi:MAG: aa3-type cytochrome c oxidase subunit IV [Pseudomonadota bacterium]
MAEEKHEHGSMDATEHQAMFDKFVGAVGWSMVVIVVALVLLWLING